MINKLNQYHPVTNDIEVLKKQREELNVCKSFLGFSSQLKPLREQLLAGVGVFLMQNIFSRLSYASESSTTTFDPALIERFVLVFSTCRGNTSRGCDDISFCGHDLSTRGRVFDRGQDNFRK